VDSEIQCEIINVLFPMLRRFLVITIRRSILILLSLCLGCVAQSVPPDVARKTERHVRSFHEIPASVEVTVGAITPNDDLPGYASVLVTFDSGQGTKKDLKLLLSKDRNTLLRLTKVDLTKDLFVEVMNRIDVVGRPWRGAMGAKVVVVN
jgi:hypothetical protein